MNGESCGREPEVVAAVRASRLEGELRLHASGCAVCGEIATVASFLGELARQPIDPALLGGADLYRRARLLERLFREPDPVAKTLRRLALAEVIGVLVSAAALLTWLVGAGSDFVSQLPLPQTLSLVSWLPASPVALSAIVILSIVAVLPMFAIWPLLAAQD